MFYLIILLIIIPGIIVLIDFFIYIISDKRILKRIFKLIVNIFVVVLIPLFYLLISDFGLDNDCCSDSAVFSPNHRLTIYIWISISIITFFYSTYRKQSSSPIIEILTNCFLLIGIVFNIVLAFHIELWLWAIGNLPVTLLFITVLIENQKKIIKLSDTDSFKTNSFLTRLASKILLLSPWLKFPILILLCLPIIVIISSILILFGQKPDSIIRAFTDTYKHGLSELDYMCENVECGGHYLTSVAANGHKIVVKPKRLGIRNNALIICNRQLLVSNAFEELIAEKTPKLHRFIRKNYNKVGNVIHKYYYLFENKFLSDLIYILMKPFELIFIITLYLFDKKPENRIARQYIPSKEKIKL